MKEYVLKVQNKFQVKAIKKGYHNLYFKFDVVLLADDFENFRNSSFKNYEFCLRHNLSAPALS